MPTIEEMVKQLPPSRQREVADFVEFLLTRRSSSIRGKMNLDWFGGLASLREEYTSVELQHEAGRWREEDAITH